MTTAIATQATAAAPEHAAELAGAMMEQMAEIPGAPADFDPAEQMAEMTANIATAVAAADPEAAVKLQVR